MKCPFEKCNQLVDESKMKDLIPNDLFEKYTKFKRNALVDRDPNLKWCPAVGCEEALSGSERNPKLICNCGQIVCFLCGNPWHENQTCEEVSKFFNRKTYFFRQ